jgi:Fe-Mn family superoxide dismutase
MHSQNSLTPSESDLGRREMLTSLSLAAATVASLGLGADVLGARQNTSPIKPPVPPVTPESMGWDPKANQFVLPPLPYKTDALEPHIDKQTMELHHGKHHAAYVSGLNRALEELASLRKREPDPTETRNWLRELAFHGSGHFLHVLFWNSMASAATGAGGHPKGAIAKEIERNFGSFKQFSDQFQAAAVAVEGGGWSILVWEPISRQLLIMQAEKHQNLTAWGVQPLLPLDVWEHAYYLKYQNKRKDYVAAFMNVINWEAVEKRWETVSGKVVAA